MSKKAPSLALSKLTCQIPDYRKILEIVKESNHDELYVKFVHKFLAYLPIDYRASEHVELFINVTNQAFEFFKTRAPGQRKIEVIKTTLLPDPSLTILLLNDDKSFIIDSLNCLFARLSIQPKIILHPVIFCIRDKEGELKQIVDANADADVIIQAESLAYVKILGNFAPQAIDSLKQELNNVVAQIDACHFCRPQLVSKIEAIVDELNQNKRQYEETILPVAETIDFLRWLQKDNFAFFGASEFKLDSNSQHNIEIGASTIWQNNKEEIDNIIAFSRSDTYQKQLVILGKINKLSPIQSSNLVDYVLIKQVDSNEVYKAGTIIFGSYNLAINYQSIQDIPILRQKLAAVLTKAAFAQNGHNSKKLKTIIESLPREALIQIDISDLYCMCLHMLSGIISHKLKLFVQCDWSGSFIHILIFLKKERLTPEIHNKIIHYLSEKINGQILTNYVTEVVQHFSYLFVTLEVNSKNNLDFELEEVEAELEHLSLNWGEAFYRKLCDKFGEYKAGVDFKNLPAIFPDDYRQKFSPTAAIEDMQHLQTANTQKRTVFALTAVDRESFQLKIFNSSIELALSDLLPYVENLGFKAIEEQSFAIKSNELLPNSWIYNFILTTPVTTNERSTNFTNNVEEALDKMAQGILNLDSLSKLIVLEEFTWHQVKLLRALTRYLHQTNFVYGKGYVQLTLIKHYKYTGMLVELFDAKFNPKNSLEQRSSLVSSLTNQVADYLHNVTSSAEDKVLRSMFNLIEAMVRTNFYQNVISNEIKNYLSFKFDSSALADLPAPRPYAEIFVYSNVFEAIHLRGGKVARGGIRWSDRGEDYRTEILGLMKAQMAKNAVIVPVGSKGGFFVKINKDILTVQEYNQQVIECYKNFLRGLLDITDNIIEGKVTHPQNTIIYDSEDPYLVVAADKGTAAFSDYANQVSAEYRFWLGDAFASGGSSGYDHKKMSITAKGAWISVQEHFQRMKVDVQRDPITVVGVGDMSGDVFGNGMLRSKAIKLVAAFNHRHIFIDPSPDPNASFDKRLRLFKLPSSSWADYNHNLISKGGGVFERSAKLILLSSEIKNLLNITSNQLAPEELIRSILQAPVDLIWNGGIGTYVKASTEAHADIGDKANDLTRCDAIEVKAKVIAEGGNLGVSQLGRIEYSKNGGNINTDFIDNSGGVDCSDHEVNIKIALNQAVVKGKLTLEERNKLLLEMTSQVERLVLMDNYKQTQAITISQLSPALTVEMYCHLINDLEQEKRLDRKVEFLPNQSELTRRIVAKERMTRPELAILLSYSKMAVYQELLSAELINNKYFETYLVNYFPAVMHERFRDEILVHPLRQEIIATILTNKIVNHMGGLLINNIKRDTGATIADIACAYIIICEIFELDLLWLQVESLPNSLEFHIKIDMFTELAKLMRRGITWLIKHLKEQFDIVEIIAEFKEPAQRLSKMIGSLLVGEAKSKFDERLQGYKLVGVNEGLASEIVGLDNLVSVFDIIHITKQTQIQDIEVASLYFTVGNLFNIDWLRKACDKQIDDSYWNRLSIQSLKDDLFAKQRQLLINFINQSKPILDIEAWMRDNCKHSSIYLDFIANIKLQESINLNIIILANKKFETFLHKLTWQ